MQDSDPFTRLRTSADLEGNLRNLLHVPPAPAGLDSPCQFQHRPLAHAVAKIIRPAGLQHRRHQAILPVIIMGKPAERSLDASYDHWNIRINLLKNTGIYRHGIVGPLSGLSFRSICVIVPQPLGCGVMIDHRVHCSGIDPEIKPWSAQFAEIPEVIPPVRLRHNRHTPAPFLKPACNAGGSERRMVDESIACENDYVNVVPSQRLDFLFRSREHVCGLFLFNGSHYILSGSWIPRISIAFTRTSATVWMRTSLNLRTS